MSRERDSRWPDTRAVVDSVKRALRRNWVQLVVYDLVLSGIALVVLLPVANAILAGLVSSSGALVIGNEDILSFVLSPAGIALILFGAVGHALLMWLNRAGFQCIVAAARAGEKATAVAALRRILVRAPRLLALVVLRTLFGALAVLPFLVAAGITAKTILSRYDINYLLDSKPAAFWIGGGILAVLAAGALAVLLFLVLRWSFSLPLLLFEDAAPREALRRSRDLTRGHRWWLCMLLLGWAVTVLVSSVLVFGLFSLFGKLVFSAVRSPLGLVVVLAAIFVVVNVALSIVLSFFRDIGLGLLALSAFRRVTGRETVLPELDVREDTRHARLLPSLLIVALLVVAGLEARVVSEFVEVRETVQITAHRGSSRTAPENTLAAVRQAIEDRADVAEIDVLETADGRVVAFHDEDLMRLAGDRRKIAETSLEDLRRVDVGALFGPEFAGERIPTLEEVIDLAGDRIRVQIELKIYPSEDRLPERVARIVEEKGYADRCIVSSLSWSCLERARKASSDLRIGYILFDKVGKLTNLDVDWLSISTRMATRSFVQAARARGQEVHVWTVNDRETMVRLVELGVDGIVTDEPALLRQVIEEYRALDDADRVLLALRNWWKR